MCCTTDPFSRLPAFVRARVCVGQRCRGAPCSKPGCELAWEGQGKTMCNRAKALQCSMCNRGRRGKAWVCKGRLESQAYVSLAPLLPLRSFFCTLLCTLLFSLLCTSTKCKCHSWRASPWALLALGTINHNNVHFDFVPLIYANYIAMRCKSKTLQINIMSTEGALRGPITYDNHLIHPSENSSE